MEPEFWHERWRRGETGWHQGEINRHLTQVWPQMALPAETRVFVPLCGKSLDLLWLAAQGHRVLGVELSRLAVDAFFAENGLDVEVTSLVDPAFSLHRAGEIEILCGDFFDLTPAHLDGVAAVYDRASLIALPPGLRPRYAGHLDGLLPVPAPRLLIALEYDQSRMPGPPFSVGPGEVSELFGQTCAIQDIASLDVIDESPRFRERGLSRMVERVYRLDPRT